MSDLPNASPEQIVEQWEQIEQRMIASCREKFGDERTDKWLAEGGIADIRRRMFYRFTGIKPREP